MLENYHIALVAVVSYSYLKYTSDDIGTSFIIISFKSCGVALDIHGVASCR